MSWMPWKKKMLSVPVADSLKSLLFEKRCSGAANIERSGVVHVVVTLGKPLMSEDLVDTKRLK